MFSSTTNQDSLQQNVTSTTTSHRIEPLDSAGAETWICKQLDGLVHISLGMVHMGGTTDVYLGYEAGKRMGDLLLQDLSGLYYYQRSADRNVLQEILS